MRMIAIVTAFVAGLLVLPSAASDNLQLTANDGLRQAHAALKAGNPGEAIRHAEDALTTAKRVSVSEPPEDLLYSAHTLLCIANRVATYFRQAETHCDTAVQLSPKNWRAYLNRAALGLDRTDLSAAQNDLKTADELGPENEWAIAANKRLLRRLMAQRKSSR